MTDFTGQQESKLSRKSRKHLFCLHISFPFILIPKYSYISCFVLKSFLYRFDFSVHSVFSIDLIFFFSTLSQALGHLFVGIVFGTPRARLSNPFLTLDSTSELPRDAESRSLKYTVVLFPLLCPSIVPFPCQVVPL